MFRRTLTIGALLLLGVAVPAAADGAGAGSRSGPHAGGPGSPFTTRAVNRAAARASASRLIGQLKMPASAVRSPSKPPGVGRALSSPGFSLTSPELIDDISWWTVDAPPSAVVAYVGSHLPHARRIVGHSVGGEPGRVTDASWSYAPPPGLSELTAAVQTDALTDGRTAVRLDAEATWLVPRPAWERIPTSVHSVSYTAHASIAGVAGAYRSRGADSIPRTLGRRDARRLAAAVDALQRMQPGVAYSCPFDAVSPRITLRFRGRGGHPVAVAVDSPSGCATVALSVGGRGGPTLNDMAVRTPIDEEMVALGAIRPCRSGQLAAGPASLALAAHHPTLTLSVRDRSRTVCTVHGYPRLALAGARGRVITHRRREVDPRGLRREGLAGTVILYPGTSAQFTARYRTCPARTRATTARIRLPGTRGTLRAPLASTGRRVTPCHGAVVAVNPLTQAL